MPPAGPPRPVVLVILDGFGERAESTDNAVRLAKTPELDALYAGYPRTLIGTSGPDVGLPVGQMGNSEVGHLCFGAGRIALTDISRIDVAIANRELGRNPVIMDLILRAKDSKARFHLFGLVSDWAMDRDKRWDRVFRAWRAIVREEGAGDPKAPMLVPHHDNVFDALRESYADGKTDEFVEPARLGDYDGMRGDYCAMFGEKPLVW